MPSRPSRTCYVGCEGRRTWPSRPSRTCLPRAGMPAFTTLPDLSVRGKENPRGKDKKWDENSLMWLYWETNMSDVPAPGKEPPPGGGGNGPAGHGGVPPHPIVHVSSEGYTHLRNTHLRPIFHVFLSLYPPTYFSNCYSMIFVVYISCLTVCFVSPGRCAEDV